MEKSDYLHLDKIPLGKETTYIHTYTPNLLFSIPRAAKRIKLNLPTPLPFSGMDIWNAYELSWLNPQGKPQIAIAEFYIPADSSNLIESKSFKLYLNSFAQTTIADLETLESTLRQDLSHAAGGKVTVKLISPTQFHDLKLQEFSGYCLDDLPITTQTYKVQADFLCTESGKAEETLYSNLLRSICPFTEQPDWGSVFICYRGAKLNHEGLLKYIISYREHGEFHEQCVEQMFADIWQRCQPEALTVYARYTRRGGLDINPFRSSFELEISNMRNIRQ